MPQRKYIQANKNHFNKNLITFWKIGYFYLKIYHVKIIGTYWQDWQELIFFLF